MEAARRLQIEAAWRLQIKAAWRSQIKAAEACMCCPVIVKHATAGFILRGCAPWPRIGNVWVGGMYNNHM